MVHGLGTIFGVVGGADGACNLCPASDLWTTTSFHCSVLWLDRNDLVLRHQGKLDIVPPLAYHRLHLVEDSVTPSTFIFRVLISRLLTTRLT